MFAAKSIRITLQHYLIFALLSKGTAILLLDCLRVLFRGWLGEIIAI